ncbi:MAG: hypothetical protein BGO49_28140 [Planctomycetales bacterium 71-10]|nr:MAG: hypothetical protein BGO49_28140 [Planctomycetales bacterium 71-10]
MAKSTSKQGSGEASSGVVLKGKVGKIGGREYVLVDLEYVQARDILKAEAYNPQTGKGWQRELNEDKAGKLVAAMRGGHYTPAAFSASISDKHTVNRKGDHVEILGVTRDTPLNQIDGQHRSWALAKLFAEDQDKWTDTTIPLLITLDHSRLAEDFLNLQKSNPVARNLLRSIEVKEGLITDADKMELITLATDVISKLALTKTSFMPNGVAYTSNEKKKMQYSSLISPGASTLATTVYGGAKIAKDKGKSAKWLYDVYMVGWNYLEKNLKPADSEIPNETTTRLAFMSDGKNDIRLLTPLSKDGNRGGTSLLIAVLNMLAWSTAKADLDAPAENDLKKMCECVDMLWAEVQFDGGSAPDLRHHAGEFAKLYYKGYRGDKHDDIPTDLLDVLSPSTFDLKGKEYKSEKREAEKARLKALGLTLKGKPMGKRGRKPKAEETPPAKSPALEAREAAEARIASQTPA